MRNQTRSHASKRKERGRRITVVEKSVSIDEEKEPVVSLLEKLQYTKRDQ